MGAQKIGETALIEINHQVGVAVDRGRTQRRGKGFVVVVAQDNDVLGVGDRGAAQQVGRIQRRGADETDLIGHRVFNIFGGAQHDFAVSFTAIAADVVDHALGPGPMPAENDNVTAQIFVAR